MLRLRHRPKHVRSILLSTLELVVNYLLLKIEIFYYRKGTTSENCQNQ